MLMRPFRGAWLRLVNSRAVSSDYNFDHRHLPVRDSHAKSVIWFGSINAQHGIVLGSRWSFSSIDRGKRLDKHAIPEMQFFRRSIECVSFSPAQTPVGALSPRIEGTPVSIARSGYRCPINLEVFHAY